MILMLFDEMELNRHNFLSNLFSINLILSCHYKSKTFGMVQKYFSDRVSDCAQQ